MSKLQTMREFVSERLSAAAEEIFALFERTIAEYEQELCRRQRLLDVDLTERVLQSPPGPGVAPGTTAVKEEPEEPSVKHEEEQEPGSVPEFSTVCVKIGDQRTQTEHKEETQEEDISSETERDTENSSNTENEDKWRGPVNPALANTETEVNDTHNIQVQIRDRITAAQNSGQSSVNKSVYETSAAVAETNEGNEGIKHQCPFCWKRFLNKHKLQTHMRVHTGERPYGCSVCEKTFSQMGNLRRHLRVHTGQTLHKCHLCNKLFTQSFHLTTHMRTHTGEKIYKCSFCPKQFTQSSNLTTHMRTHTKEKPYHCTTCKKEFSKKGNLDAHMRTHTGDKPFNCSLCEKKFIQKSQLNTHMRTHTNDKPYSCLLCNKNCTQVCSHNTLENSLTQLSDLNRR